jgi:flavin reductase (DIM6/NTAB) family NADH-FMN oxidoreductase RutF
MAAAWVSRVNFKPPMMMIALGAHHTNRGIDAHGAYSINVPASPCWRKPTTAGWSPEGRWTSRSSSTSSTAASPAPP